MKVEEIYGDIMFCLEINSNEIVYKTIKDIIEEGLYYEVSTGTGI